VLLTGKAVAPGIFEVMAMLGQSKTIHRLQRASPEITSTQFGGQNAPPVARSS
jgi:hypothetical protein